MPSELGFLLEGISVKCCKTKSKESQRNISRSRSKNRLQALSVRKRNKPRSRLDLLFNLADSKYGVSFSSTPIILRSKAKPKQSTITFHTQLESILFSGIVFTLPDVEVKIQKDPKFNRLRLSCHSYSFKGVQDLFNQKLGFFFTTNFRAHSFCPSFIYLLTTRSIPQRIILSLFSYKLCPSLNRGVARFFKNGSQRQTKGTRQIVISTYRPSRRVLPIIT